MEFTEEEGRQLAQQLRKPEGKMGVQIANMMNQSNLSINQDAVNALELADNDRILEVGPGNGFFAKDLIKKVKNVTYVGCDYSELMVQQAVSLNQKLVESKQVRFVHASCDQMPFENEEFTHVLTVNTIYFWPNAEAVLQEFSRVLTHGGQLVIALRPEANLKAMPFTKYGFKFWTEERLTQLFKKSPFSLIEVQINQEGHMEIEGESMPLENYIVMAEKRTAGESSSN